MYFEVRGELPAPLRKRMEAGLGIETSIQQTGRALIEVQLARRTEEELLKALSSMAASTVYRSDNAEQFDKSVSGSQSLAFIAHAGANPVDSFLMNEAYLKAQVKAGIVEDCKRSGFMTKFNEVNGEKAFDKLLGSKSDDLIKAILAFTEFSWLGYLPTALELSAQGGSDQPNATSHPA